MSRYPNNYQGPYPNPSYPAPQGHAMNPAAPPYPGPPPPYAPPGGQPAYYHPAQQMPMQPNMMYHAAPMPAYYPQMAPMHMQSPQNPATVVVKGAFDPGARFDSTSQARIPPPPPGVTPNAAQMAAMHGHNVVGTQRSENPFFGSSGGGYTWW